MQRSGVSAHTVRPILHAGGAGEERWLGKESREALIYDIRERRGRKGTVKMRFCLVDRHLASQIDALNQPKYVIPNVVATMTCPSKQRCYSETIFETC